MKHCLASKFGNPIEEGRIELSYAKAKNYNYDAISEAYKLARGIFENSLTSNNPDLSGLEKAIEIWENEINEVNYSNKKARISGRIALGLSFNIIQSSVWLNDFNKAFNKLDELSKMDLKPKDMQKIKYCREFALDRKQRIEANLALKEGAKM